MDNRVGEEYGVRWSKCDVMGMCGLSVLKDCPIFPLAYNSLCSKRRGKMVII